MKKLLAFVITAVLALGLLSCGGKNESQKESSTPEQTESISASESESTRQSENEPESSSEAVINGEVLETGRITVFIPEGWSLIDLGAYTDEFTAVILKGTQEDFMAVPQISIIYMVPTEMAISAAAYYDNVIQQPDFDMGNYHWTSWTGSSSGLKSFVAEAEGEFGFISVNLQQVEPDGEMPSIEDEEVKAIIKSISVRPTVEIDWINLDGNTATAELKAYEDCHWKDSGNMAQQTVDVDYEIEGNVVTFTSNAGTGGFKLQLVLVNDEETLKLAEANIHLKLEDGKFDAVYNATIKEYDEPIVTYTYRSSYGGSGLLDYVLANKTRLQAGKNNAFHTRTSGQMNDLLNGFIKDDYEYALWAERLGGRNSTKGFEALKEYLGETYPNAAWNEYVSLQGRYWSYRKDDVKAFIDKYSGKAIGLFGKALLFDDRMNDLSRNKGTEADYKALYADIKAAEKERLSYKSGVDSKIAGTVKSFQNQMETLDDKDVSIFFEGDDIVVTLRNLPSVEVSMYLDNKEGTPLFKKTVDNPRKSFYVLDTVKVPFPRCDDGNYIVKARFLLRNLNHTDFIGIKLSCSR